jgi:uncharacterized membrane protein
MKIIVYAIFLIAIANTCLAISIESYSMIFDMGKSQVMTEISIIFNESITGEFGYKIAPRSTLQTLHIDGNKVETRVQQDLISLNLTDNQNITISYKTDYYLDKDDFLFDFRQQMEIKKLTIELKLRESSELEEAIENEAGSIFPKPDEAKTDGKRIIFLWNKKDIPAGSNIAFYAKIKGHEPFAALLVGVALTAAIGAVAITIIMKKTKQTDISNHLTDDENAIINVIKQRDGKKIEQGTLQIVTGYSKAGLSRLLSEMESRKIIHKEKKGKKNVIWLKHR